MFRGLKTSAVEIICYKNSSCWIMLVTKPILAFCTRENAWKKISKNIYNFFFSSTNVGSNNFFVGILGICYINKDSFEPR